MQNRAVFVLATLFTSGLLVGTSVVSASAAGAPGSLEPTFGNDGVASTGFDDLGLGPSGVAIRHPARLTVWVWSDRRRRHRRARRFCQDGQHAIRLKTALQNTTWPDIFAVWKEADPVLRAAR